MFNQQLYTYVRTYVCIYVCMCMYVHVCMYVCTYVCKLTSPDWSSLSSDTTSGRGLTSAQLKPPHTGERVTPTTPGGQKRLRALLVHQPVEELIAQLVRSTAANRGLLWLAV